MGRLSLQIRLLDVVLLVVLIGLLVFGFKDIVSFFNRDAQEPTEPRIIRVDDNIVIFENVKNNEAFKKIIDELREEKSRALKETEVYVKKAKSKIVSIGTITTITPSDIKEQEAESYKDPELSTRDYYEVQLSRKVKDDELPVGWVKFHPELLDEEPFTVFLYPLEYNLTLIKTEKEDGSFSYTAETWIENKYINRDKIKKYPIEISQIRFEEVKIREKSFFYNPTPILGVSVANVGMSFYVGAAFFSYGRTYRDMDWQFLGIGVGFNEEEDSVLVTAVPISYNIGNKLPVITNSFVSPIFSYDLNNNKGVGCSIHVPF